jgi:HPr kinase/phosphorylase
MTGTRGNSLQIHGTCVALDGQGLLLRGPSGSGKSDLALRLIDRGAGLVADDLCQIWREDDRLMADLPAAVGAAFRGRIEARGIGMLTLAYFGPVSLALVVDLQVGAAVERMAQHASADYLGVALPLVVLDPFQASAAAKLRLVARGLPGSIMRPS